LPSRPVSDCPDRERGPRVGERSAPGPEPAQGPSSRRPAAVPAEEKKPVTRDSVLKVFRNDVTPFLKEYCIGCHGERRFKGGISFVNALKRPEAGEFRRQWQVSLAMVRSRPTTP
jgi:hypothetical protein